MNKTYPNCWYFGLKSKFEDFNNKPTFQKEGERFYPVLNELDYSIGKEANKESWLQNYFGNNYTLVLTIATSNLSNFFYTWYWFSHILPNPRDIVITVAKFGSALGRHECSKAAKLVSLPLFLSDSPNEYRWYPDKNAAHYMSCPWTIFAQGRHSFTHITRLDHSHLSGP